ncbi:MAG: tetratricopeptide repeat protein [Fidelibacterota bacterium]|nr:MAG: tetratricopeptide repeat protein [Candidatus Neomarinimicrobiota bacterium]
MVRLRYFATFVLISILAGRLSAGATEEAVYQRGMDAYASEQWSLAIQEFESILRSGYEAELLYYNLGNAYYRAGHVAGAVWAYEKALILNPNDDDARYNLALANLRVKDRIELPEIPFYIRFYRGVRESLTPGEWMRWVSIVLFLVGLFYALNRILRRPWLGWLMVPGTVIATFLFLITLDSIITTNRIREGIIYGEQVTVTSAPSERSTMLFELHEGLKVSVLEQSDDWYQIELLDGKSGWLPADQLRVL